MVERVGQVGLGEKREEGEIGSSRTKRERQGEASDSVGLKGKGNQKEGNEKGGPSRSASILSKKGLKEKEEGERRREKKGDRGLR